jgi:hypothetical protein
MDASVEVWADLGHTVEDEHVIDHLRLGQFVALDRSLGETVWIGTRSGVVASAALIFLITRRDSEADEVP